MPHFGTLTNNGSRTPASSGLRAVNARPLATSEAEAATLAEPQGGVTLPMIMATILVFMHFGRPFDAFLNGYHIPLVIGSIGIVVMFFTRWQAVLTSRVGIPLATFICVMAVSAVFSTWRGGSAVYVYQYTLLNFVFFLLIGAAPTTIPQIRWLILVFLLGSIFNFAIGAHLDSNGRLYLEDTMLGNSDDVALCGGISIPVVLLLAKRMGKVFGTIFGVVGVATCLAAIEMSGTRFALIALAVMAIVYFVRAGGMQRVALIICFTVIVVGSLLFLPKAILARFGTITSAFTGETTDDQPIEAIGSTYERQQLLKDGVTAFLTHPITGVGPDVFVDWRWSTMGKHGQPTHNTYLQAAAEEGIFGAIFYIVYLGSALLTLHRSTKTFKGWEEGSEVSVALETSLIYFATSAFTLTCVGHMHQFFLAGLGVALERLRLQQVAASEPAALAPLNQVMTQAPTPPQIAREEPSRPRPSLAPPATAPVRPARYRFNRPIATTTKQD